MPLTRTEALCACSNIMDLIEAMSEILPDEYAKGVHERAKGMKDYIESTNYDHVTEKMDRAIRGIWNGLRKWDHKDEYNDNLFSGLADWEAKVVLSEENQEVVVEDGEESRPTMDEGFDLPQATDTQKEVFKQRQQAFDQRRGAMKVEKETGVTVTEEKFSVTKRPSPAGIMQEEIVRSRENHIAQILQRFHGDAIRVVDKKVVQFSDISSILKKTTSDRTQQLIKAAYYAGSISGASEMASDLLGKVKG